MGVGSTAKIPIQGDLNEDWELLLKSYAVSFDSLNANMLTPEAGKFKQTSANHVKAEFYRIKLLCRKHAPHKLKEIEKLERISLANISGRISDKKALAEIRAIGLYSNVSPSLFFMAEQQINAAENVNNPKKMPGLKMYKETAKYKPMSVSPLKPRKKYNAMELLDSLLGVGRRK